MLFSSTAEKLQMRDVAHDRNMNWNAPGRLAKLVPGLVALAAVGWGLSLPGSAVGEDKSGEDNAGGGAQVRIVSFQGDSSEAPSHSYFAAAIQPSADDALLAEVKKPAADVIVVVDTSASQSGEYRREALAAADQVLNGLRSGDRAQLFAADV